jgi:putative DNA primase/helicase
MASNYDDVLGQLNALGLCVTDLEPGRLVRCRVEGDREKRGWYMLHELQMSGGDVLLVGTYGIWHGNDSGTLKVELRKRDKEFSQEQRDALKHRMAEDRKRVARERAAAAERAAARATSAWARYSEDGDSEYLEKKGVQGYGLRYTASGSAVLPLLDVTGKIHGLQFLRTAKQAEEAKRPAKEFWPAGIVKKGHFHLIGSPQWIVLVAEGYATAASLHMATGYPVAVTFDAGNLAHVAAALHKRYRAAKVLICADDDILQKCRHCKSRVVLPLHPKICPGCEKEHEAENAGITCASAAALEVAGAWVAPRFDDEPGRQQKYLATGRKLTDFNDLHSVEGLHNVRVQIEARLTELSWSAKAEKKSPTSSLGDGGEEKLRPLQSTDELLRRFSLVYAHSGAVFDHNEHMLMSLSDMRDACIRKDIHRAWCESPDRDVVRIREVGFDPGYEDSSITCNLWSGWPTTPAKGSCEKLLEMLWHMCSNDVDSKRLYAWVLKWLAYPIQKPGAKLKTTIVVHGPQGTGKNLFFESVMSIYGLYGDVIDQSAIEDKFNDWASRKLFMIADEVVARSDMWHIKNRLKTLISGSRIRINPKNFAAYWEANHLNLVFLSNETMPVVLEEDDRRHCVIWTPPKLLPDFYKSVLAEIEAGGVAALHDYLLNLPLDDFHPGAMPPLTEAKLKLIEQSLDSPTRFFYDLQANLIGGIKPRPALTKHVFDLYRHWCAESNYRAAPLNKFVVAMELRHKIVNQRKRYQGSAGMVGPHGVLFFESTDYPATCPDGAHEPDWLGKSIDSFREAVKDYKGASE